MQTGGIQSYIARTIPIVKVQIMLLAAIAVLMVVAFDAQSNSIERTVLTSHIGQSYSKVRKYLVSHGFRPVNQNAMNGRLCLGGMETICDRYKELASCAVDALTPCRFEWATAKNGRSHIVTNGSNLESLRVVGYQND